MRPLPHHGGKQSQWTGLQCMEPRLLLSIASGDVPIISEFMARNTSTLADEDGAFSDWFELHNPTTEDIDLTGWYLTDKSDELTKWKIPSLSLAPGEHRLLFASDKNKTDPASELHTNFSLNDQGEYFALVMPDGVTVAHSYDPYPAQSADVSYGIAINVDTLNIGTRSFCDAVCHRGNKRLLVSSHPRPNLGECVPLSTGGKCQRIHSLINEARIIIFALERQDQRV